MNNSIWKFRTDDILHLRSGAVVRVALPSEDGEWIPVYHVGGQLLLAAQSDLVHQNEIEWAATLSLN